MLHQGVSLGYKKRLDLAPKKCVDMNDEINNKPIRLRFAPSPTGGLHLGGLRTLLYNFLFVQQQGGKLILRIEDTDQKRFVAGAEQYIFECCQWLGINIDESVQHGGEYGPYRQSERKALYQQYVQQLIDGGLAYYAFDTPEELDAMRESFKSVLPHDQIQYDQKTRMKMTNSLTLSAEETKKKLDNKTPFVIRIKMPEQEQIVLPDAIRGAVHFDSQLLDDKVLMKADGLPTYHFAVVVDDYLMKISHVLRGEEWLPSAGIHALLWRYLGWEKDMPIWIHLPLILKPDGNGKLSKRDSERLGIPIYALQWKDATSGDLIEGFKEKGFVPQALSNFLALSAWNDGSTQEVFSIDELIQKFSLERLHHHSAKFDYEKAKWYNETYLQQMPTTALTDCVKNCLVTKQIQHHYTDTQLEELVELTKARCQLINDFYDQNAYLFHKPTSIDTAALTGKWNADKKKLFEQFIVVFEQANNFSHDVLHHTLQEFCATQNIKLGEIQLPLRVMLVGGKFGIGVTHILALIGKKESIERITNGLNALSTIA